PRTWPDDRPGFDDLLVVVRQALAALGIAVESGLVQMLRDGDAHARRRALIALHRVRANAEVTVRALITALDDDVREVRYRALVHLLAMHEHAHPAIPRLRRALSSSDAGMRSMAARILSRIDRTPETARALVGMLDDRGSPLSEWGERQPDRTVGDIAYEAVAHTRMFDPAVPALLEALRRGGERARRLLWERAEQGDPYTLTKLLATGNRELRRTAARSLPRRRPAPLRASRTHLEPFRDDPDPVVRECVRQALAKIRPD
ncbi:MAG: HEAT repeat domain-containing protein, partial [Planctomycetota bacterium]|nr:HEAT repeat domain-containing protein [Planctomycetota bacterium]